MTLFGITGATGHLGGRVARRLAEQGEQLRLVVRDPSRAPQLPGARVASATYDDAAALEAAFAGVDALLLVSAAEHPERRRQHRTAVEAAARAGVQHLVYTSFAGAAPDGTFTLGRDHFDTEQALRATGLAVTLLRNNFYADLLPQFADREGVLRGPAGEGRVAAVARDDAADSAVAVLLGAPEHDGATYELSGPQALTLDEVAAEISSVSGRPVRYERETREQAYASRAHYGAQPFQVEAWVSTYTAIAAGETAAVTGDVQRLLGRAPLGLRQVLVQHPENWAHLQG